MSNPYEDEKTSEGEGEGGEETVEGGAAQDPDGELGESPGGAWQGEEEREATKKSAAGRRKRAAGRRAAAPGRVRNLPDVRPAVVRAALSAPRRRPTAPKLYGVAATMLPGDEIITAALVPRAGATAPPAGSWYHVFWAQKPVPRPADYTDIAGARAESGRQVQIPIRGDRGWYYVQVVGPSGSGFVTTKSNRLKVPSVPEPSRRPPSAPPTATPLKVARSDRRFFGQAA